MTKLTNTSILQPGENCWKAEAAKRVAVAVDAESYFRSVREAILSAQHSVFILGWDIHSRLRLVRDNKKHKHPVELGALLDFVARKNSVDIYVLSWDFATIYMLERETFPLYMLNWKTHARVKFQMDDQHPIGASQHQKIVVIDDQIAFCGGLDLSKWRWDTSEHTLNDTRRVDPDGKPYQPFHDVQMLVDGKAAEALGELARERWFHATGETIAKVNTPDNKDLWPDSLPPIIRNVLVGIARTRPDYRTQSSVQEVEKLYLDSIAAARKFIYIENQYLTSHSVQKALVQSLQKKKGPEVVIVMPEKTGGWLEQHTMDVLRARLVKQLRKADHANRLRIYYPQLDADTDISLMVHAKLMIVDDCFLRVASSNLSNRSMGLDSECDLAIEVDEGSDEQSTIEDLRLSLICEHLAIDSEQFKSSQHKHNSFILAIEIHRGSGRTLQKLDPKIDPEIDQLVPDSALIDPEQPIDSHRFVTHFVPDKDKPHTAKQLFLGAAILATILLLSIAWRWTPLNHWVDINTIINHIELIRAYIAAPILVVVLFAIAGALAVPLTLLVVSTVLVFGSLAGFVYALAGAFLGALLSYLLGRYMGRNLVRRYAGKRLNHISKKLSERGILTIITLRIIPVAPFTLINLVAGASHIRMRDFAIGSFIGLLPGIIAIALFAESVAYSLRSPDSRSLTILLSITAIIFAIMYGLRKWLQNRPNYAGSDDKGQNDA